MSTHPMDEIPVRPLKFDLANDQAIDPVVESHQS